MIIYKTRWFSRFASKVGIGDSALCDIASDIEKGTVDADLGGGVFKQRLAKEDSGKSGGYRIILLYRKAHMIFFVFGFSKNKQDNISPTELRDFKKLAKIMFGMSPDQIKDQVESGYLERVYDKKKNQY